VQAQAKAQAQAQAAPASSARVLFLGLQLCLSARPPALPQEALRRKLEELQYRVYIPRDQLIKWVVRCPALLMFSARTVQAKLEALQVGGPGAGDGPWCRRWRWRWLRLQLASLLAACLLCGRAGGAAAQARTAPAVPASPGPEQQPAGTGGGGRSPHPPHPPHPPPPPPLPQALLHISSQMVGAMLMRQPNLVSFASDTLAEKVEVVCGLLALPQPRVAQWLVENPMVRPPPAGSLLAAAWQPAGSLLAACWPPACCIRAAARLLGCALLLGHHSPRLRRAAGGAPAASPRRRPQPLARLAPAAAAARRC
jgi:hypothetical protein